MRDMVAKAYQYVPQAAGTYGALAALACFAGLPTRPSAGQPVIVPLAVTATALQVAVTLMRPSLVPIRFLSPRRPAELLPVLLGNGLLAVLFALPCMGAAPVFGLSRATLSRARHRVRGGALRALRPCVSGRTGALHLTRARRQHRAGARGAAPSADAPAFPRGPRRQRNA